MSAKWVICLKSCNSRYALVENNKIFFNPYLMISRFLWKINNFLSKMILLSFLGTFCVLLRNTEALRPDLRAYRWRHNNPKEDPITRRRFKAGIHGHDLIEKNINGLIPWKRLHDPQCKADVEGTCNEELDIDEEMVGQFATEGFEEFYYPNNSGRFLRSNSFWSTIFIYELIFKKPHKIADGLLRPKMIWWYRMRSHSWILNQDHLFVHLTIFK